MKIVAIKVKFQEVMTRNVKADKNSVMQSVTKEENTDVQVPKPAIKSICRDKNCQSTRCYRSPRRPKCDKNCQ